MRGCVAAVHSRCRRRIARGTLTPAATVSAPTRSAVLATFSARGDTTPGMRFVASDWLKNHVKVMRHAKPGTKSGYIRFLGPDVVEDECVSVEKRFDVDQLPRPIPLIECLVAKLKVAVPSLRSKLAARDLIGSRRTQYGCSARSRQNAGIGAPFQMVVVTLLPGQSSGAIDRREHFPELDATVALDHHELSTLESRIAID
jgi:hypothetical protein